MRPSSGGGSTGRRGVSRFLLEMFHRYREHDISRQSAALSYYLLFALFPILIFLSSLLGVLHLDVDSVLDAIQAVLPNTVAKQLEEMGYAFEAQEDVDDDHTLVRFVTSWATPAEAVEQFLKYLASCK